MRAVPVPLRQRFDYFRTGLRGRIRYHVAVISLLAGIAGFVATPFGWTYAWILGVAGLALAVVQFIPEWRASRRGKVQLVTVESPVDWNELQLDNGQLLQWRSEGAVADDAIDAVLPESQATVAWSRRRTPLPDDLAPHAYDTLRELIRAPGVYNGRLIRQDGDLEVTRLSRDGDVSFSTTTYFTLMLTNYMEHAVRLASTREWIQHPRELLDDGRGRLWKLSDSRLANPIGVSTLAFTTDGKVVVILQSTRNKSAGGELAPSGSGSLDLRDVRRARWGRRQLLIDAIRHGMERELREEASIKQQEIEWTRVIGYFRWMNKGAKPEYVGVTKLTLHSRELKRRSIPISETHYVAGRGYGEVALRALEEDPDAPAALVVDELPGQPSLPLIMTLRALGNALRRGGDLAVQLRTLT